MIVSWLALILSVPVACVGFGVLAGLAAWISGLMTLGAIVVGVIGAWPRTSGYFLVGGAGLAAGCGAVWLL